jgi:hypothetical protein
MKLLCFAGLEVLFRLRECYHFRVMTEAEFVSPTGHRNPPGDPRIVSECLIVQPRLIESLSVTSSERHFPVDKQIAKAPGLAELRGVPAL